MWLTGERQIGQGMWAPRCGNGELPGLASACLGEGTDLQGLSTGESLVLG